MKRTVSALLAAILLLALLPTLVFCSQKKSLSGEYSNGAITYKFNANGDVTVVGLTGGSYDGTYEISTVTGDDGKEETKIVFSGFSGLGSLYNGTFTLVTGKDSDQGEYIKLSGLAYYKK